MPTNVAVQDTDLQLVEKTVNYYMNGLVNQDAELLTKAFHPTATMKWIGADYKEVNAVKTLTSGMNPSAEKPQVKTRVISIHMAGNAASAQLELEYPTFTYIDFMNILKVDGNWQIVSKIFHKRVKD